VKGYSKQFLVISAALASLALPSCFSLRTIPPPARTDTRVSAIGISVSTNDPIAPEIREVYFVKLEKDEDLLTSKELIASNFSGHGQFYLLNAKPGRYAAVACLSRKKVRIFLPDMFFEIFFSRELIKPMVTSVGPGQVAFMGKYVVAVGSWREDADEAWTHYFRILQAYPPAGSFLDSFSEDALNKPWFLGGSYRDGDRGTIAEKQFFLMAMEDLKGTSWSEVFKQRLDSLPAGP